jgi:hypothetical protein
MGKLPIVRKTEELIHWYVPILFQLPKDYKINLGQRMVSLMYKLLEDLLEAQQKHKKLAILESCNVKLDILRYETDSLVQFNVLDEQIREFANVLINQIGNQLGAWIKQREKEEGLDDK